MDIENLKKKTENIMRFKVVGWTLKGASDFIIKLQLVVMEFFRSTVAFL